MQTLKVHVDLKKGVQSVYNKQTKQNISLTHELYYYNTAYDGMSAYVYGARFSAEIYTRGCHWIPRLLA